MGNRVSHCVSCNYDAANDSKDKTGYSMQKREALRNHNEDRNLDWVNSSIGNRSEAVIGYHQEYAENDCCDDESNVQNESN